MKNEENLQGPFSQKREYYGNLRVNYLLFLIIINYLVNNARK